MMKRQTSLWRTASAPVFYLWVTGAALIWLLLPASVIDLFLAPRWFAPHWQCDSLGIPVFQAYAIAAPFAGVALAVTGLLTFVATYKRTGGGDIFALGPIWTLGPLIVTMLTLALSAPFLWSVATFVTDVVFLKTWVEDCAGRADPIAVSQRRPLWQTTPVLHVFIIVWLLHLRTYALSDRKPNR